MDKEKRQDIALMRYSAIAPPYYGDERRRYIFKSIFSEVSAKGITAPDGKLRHFAPVTIGRWYHSYKQGGFEALLPASRSDAGKPRKLDDGLQEQVKHLKTNYPRMSAAAIFRQLKDNGSIKNGEISQVTVNRYINQVVFQEKHTAALDMRRYEMPHINEVWCGDSSVGPYLKIQGRMF